MSFNGSSIQDVTRHLEGLRSLADLKVEDFAPEGKIADIIAQRRGDMKFTQIRKFFGEIKRIEKKNRNKRLDESVDKTDIFLLLPELAYGFGRKVISREFYEVMKTCLTGERIKTVADFRRFVDLLTAIVAYYKMHER